MKITSHRCVTGLRDLGPSGRFFIIKNLDRKLGDLITNPQKSRVESSSDSVKSSVLSAVPVNDHLGRLEVVQFAAYF